jgi:addiction module HigA family antidote
LEPLGLSQYRLAKDLTVPALRLNEIVHGDRAISADTALRLARYFGTSDRFWLNLQAAYDLDVQRDRLGARLESGGGKADVFGAARNGQVLSTYGRNREE